MSNLREIAEGDLSLTLEDPSGFGFPIVVTDPLGSTFTVYGQSGDIGFLIDPETGLGLSGRTAHISIRIKSLLDAGSSIITKGWKISFPDINGNEWNFLVDEARPDRTLGIVTCMVSLLVSDDC